MILKTSSETSANLVLQKSLVIISIICLISFSCGRTRDSKLRDNQLPALLPPPPIAPSMVGSDTIWDFSGQEPILPGSQEALFNYIAKNLHYPDSAKAKGIEGKVIVKFCVSKRGIVSEYAITQSVHPELDAEALRVIKTITRFEPGYQEGKPVSVWYQIPIAFRLK